MKKFKKNTRWGLKILTASMSIHSGKVLEVARELIFSSDTLQQWKKLYKDGKFGGKK